ncbi:hypothetical protein [Pedobacter rhodius]|uniref:Outer membrane protein beta-barrel domain-containing protein n=1 Tax=Pedobacter rhodius TaxID=3004098 RepID=A0ABT4KXM2_9SPHI|nr:hypothetical protein [Pedobacter sp. SJ11]MCZ4223680.1 hypothetical protein [Pedobacter sp. SJ11]
MKIGNDIDNLFKEGLEHPDIPFNDAHWQALEEHLHPKPTRRIAPVIWFSALSGLAAMLLIVFFVIKPAEKKSNPNAVVKTKAKQNDGKKTDVENEHQKGLKTEKNDGLPQKNQQVARVNKSVIKNSMLKNSAKAENASNPILEPDALNKNLLENTTALNNSLSLENLNQLVVFNGKKTFPTDFGQPKDKVVVKKSGSRPRFVLSILAAPDLTSVKYSGKSNLSGSIGAELTFSLTKRLSITTGAAYAKKIYESDFSLYNPNSSYVFKTEPTNVYANCDVIDIPLNVNYKVFNGKRNSVSVSTGLSSYLMLKEKYSYTYNSAYPGPASYEVKNQNQHYLGIANIGVEFRHKINSKLSISARPFMKIPLTNIGYGNSKLSSTGVAVSVNMNLFRKSN